MTGANYMGGKRNAARARTKDSTSRVQKRHFGQQRLAAALCNTKEERGRPERMSLKSVLHQINLAHAQRDAKIKDSYPSTAHSSSTGTSRNPSESFAHGTSFVTSKRRKKPSKILRTLDFSDPVAYRDAIDRILSIPLSEMIGLSLQEMSPRSEDGGPGIDPHEDILLPIDGDSESDVQFQGTSSVIFSHTGIYDNHLNGRISQPSSPDHRMVTSHESPLRSLSIEADSLHGSWVNDSGYADVDVSETGNLRGSMFTHDIPDPQRYTSPPSNSFPFSFGSDSQETEEYILDMDTSPPSSHGSFSKLHGGWSSNHKHFLQRFSTSPVGSPALIATHDSLESFGRDSPIKCSSPVSQSLCHTRDVKQIPASSFETQYTSTTPQKVMTHAAQTSEAVMRSFTEISNTGNRRPFHNSHSAGRTEPVELHSFNSSHRLSSFRGLDIHDPGLPLDILNDPDPWATIGKILNLDIVEEHDNDDILFTCGREGVGYVRRHLDETAHEGSQSEETPSPYHSNPAEDMNFAGQGEPLCTLIVAESEMQTESPCIPTTLVHRVSLQDVQRIGMDDDYMYEGPRLFGDSDEEDG
ncbi:hypothetical protein BDR07DRAFT_1389723 [Suillus spraguei]|nr:hypothetical protein BDR07DRAFT_1389723 [Suillus spraguei]